MKRTYTTRSSLNQEFLLDGHIINKKRKYNRTENNPHKLSWVSATDTRNYMIKDTLVDFLRERKRNNLSPPNICKQVKFQSTNFQSFLFRRGQDYETNIMKYLHNTGLDFITISSMITPKTCKQAKTAIKNGIPLLYSVPVQNHTKKTQGVIDILIRSDFLHVLTGINPIPEENRLTPLKVPYYVVIDIKFSTLPLRADGTHLLNSGNYPAYKSQLYIYTQAIGEITGFTSSYAFILGRRYSYIQKGRSFSSLNCLDKLGMINYSGVDAGFKDQTEKAVSWVREVRKHHKTWSLSPPSRPELYPNMCVNSGEYNQEKKEISERLGDITQLWYCGTAQRDYSFSQGIRSWRHPGCSSSSLGVNGIRANTIDKIIKVNRDSKEVVLPVKITSTLHDWRNQGVREAYVDFETFIDIFNTDDNLPEQPNSNMIFMIGVWYHEVIPHRGRDENQGSYTYKPFTVKSADLTEENRIMQEFSAFSQGFDKLWYWHAEKALWSSAEKRQIVKNWREGRGEIIYSLPNMYDLCELFRTEPIVVKNCFNFSLKNIAKAMHNHGLVKTVLPQGCSSGVEACAQAWKAIRDGGSLASVEEYNRFDVKILWEILTYLRNNF